MILHITTGDQWRTAVEEGIYHLDSLEREGFIHCSTRQQVLGPANALFHGQEGLKLLIIDPDLVQAPIIYEDCYQSGQAYPHIYGPLNLDAIQRVINFPVNADGSFTLPKGLEVFLMKRDFPILEFDAQRQAIIEPGDLLQPLEGAEHIVLCFFQDVISSLKENGSLQEKHKLGSEIGPNYLYEMRIAGRRLGVFHPGIGAPLSAGFMDELVALGYSKFIACGGCGVLDSSVKAGNVVVPTTAVRDEGTSYHYLPPAREVSASPEAVAAIRKALEIHQVDYVMGKTWTTDALYRETPNRVALRREEGCLTVEMEMAAFCAVAAFRGVTFGQILYGGDDISGEQWDHRGWQNLTSTREKLFRLAAEACLLL